MGLRRVHSPVNHGYSGSVTQPGDQEINLSVTPPTVSPYSTGIDTSGHSIDELFPVVDPEFEPFGSRVMVQLKRTISTTKSGIILSQETKDNEAWNIQVARIISVGPLAFKNRESGNPWPEGVWGKAGDYVLVPRWGGERRSIPATDNGTPVVVVVLNDSDLIGKFTGDPLAVKSYIA